ncbi:RNA polymerase sigma factor SigJ [Williamsia sp. 1135]|uniref:RNA polymerase sigma factor SigJ n=1 Tax=Williamsia sp. 1135 TaxID=1889262 RepID=UPI000A1114A3|nr:RNA polymerase sigma factor SigJ [Williamsia sp. 1135]ORM27790.1 RNA polymerase subunit sigma-24 [Williamsia sp. 1135]
MSQATALNEFERLRPRLFGIAYRMTGAAGEAEDLVQDAWLRWQGTDHDVVRNAEAFLVTTVTRLSINAVTSARATRETYIGPWLPEPVSTVDDPALGAVRAEALEMAVVLLLERLDPRERAAYILREAFDYPYREIARLLETNEANARQLARRAREHVGRERHTSVDPDERARVMTAFVAAAQAGDLAALEAALTADVVSISDGGGIVSAARVPIFGRDKVARFVLGAVTKFAVGSYPLLVECNGGPAVLTVRDGKPDTLLSFEFSAPGTQRSGAREGSAGISRLMFVRNPGKLTQLEALIPPVDPTSDGDD